MANFFEHKDRRVVPNWRSFGKTTILGELNSFQLERREPIEETSIEDYVIDFNFNKTIIHASELLSAAILNSKRDHESVTIAAKFILENSTSATRSQLSLAHKILNKSTEEDITARFKDINISNLTKIIDPQPFYDKIHETKILLRAYPFNAILYVELSRYYSILGQEENSIMSMKKALHLAPNNRFILRSATRLFAHYSNEQNDYLDYIHLLLRNSPMTLFDPWLASAEISISTIRGRNSRYIKKGIELINSGNISPFNFTELASSIATVELINGSTKKSRELFNKSLINPNDNSLAQVEWASTKDNQLEITQSNYEVRMNFEALALDDFNNNSFNNALDNAVKWYTDQPFSKRPIMFGANLASTILKDQGKAIALLRAGLLSHPNDPQLINNLAYSLALENNPQDAIEQLDSIKYETDIDIVTKICLKATRGLAFFRNGDVELGRELYIEAIEQTKKIDNQKLNWVAILNYTREEILHKSEFVKPLMDTILKIPDNVKEIEIRALHSEVLELYLKSTENDQNK